MPAEAAIAFVLIDTSYAVEGFGEALPPQDLIFLVVFAGFAGKYHQKRIFLGRPAALQTSTNA
jgi:hypothetical protein